MQVQNSPLQHKIKRITELLFPPAKKPTQAPIDLQKVTALHFAEISPLKPVELPEDFEDGQKPCAHAPLLGERVFEIFFYALAGLLGILVVQTVWQIAILTLPQ
jgi:hypothetical protein